MYQGTAEGELLFHATRQLGGLAGTERCELAVNVGHEMVVGLDRGIEHRGKEAQILLDRQVAVQREPSGHIAHPAANGPILLHYIEATHRSTAGIGCQQRCQNTEKGGLPGTVGTDDSEYFARRHLERDVVEGLYRAV